MKPFAYCTIRTEPQYRRDAFCKGLRAAGYDVQPQHAIGEGKPGQVLVIWNRYGGLHETATRFERNGGTVLVAENGFMANDRFNRTRYAIARSGHNGQGVWHVGGVERFDALGLEIKPWRTTGTHILVTPSRSFGKPGHLMPGDWAVKTCAQLARLTARPVRVREHPGENRPKRTLADDLRDCWAMVTWYSSTGIDALLAGVPVFYAAPNWVAQRSGVPFKQVQDPVLLEHPPLLDRWPGLTDVAWAQWHVDEIATGRPFNLLCPRTEEAVQQ